MPYLISSCSKRLATVLLLTLAGLAAECWATVYPLPPGSGSLVGEDLHIKAEASDTLLGIAHQYSVGYWEIQEANPHVDMWLPGQGTPIVIPGRYIIPPGLRSGIVINLPQHRLFYFPRRRPHDLQIVITYPVSPGEGGWPTPVGVTRIIRKVPHPVWIPTAAILRQHAAEGDPIPRVWPAGPDNPMGEWALETGLDRGLIYLHGTNNPLAIGMAVTHGCVRLYPEDIAALYRMIHVGTSVQIINEPVLAALADGKLYLEVHPSNGSGDVPVMPDYGRISQVIDRAIGDKRVAIDWDHVREAARTATGIPQLVGVQAYYELLPVRPVSAQGERASGRRGSLRRNASGHASET